jgi:hypothetical protein
MELGFSNKGRSMVSIPFLYVMVRHWLRTRPEMGRRRSHALYVACMG